MAESLFFRFNSVRAQDENDNFNFQKDKCFRPLFCALLSLLDCTGTDHGTFYALILLYSIGQNEGKLSLYVYALNMSFLTHAALI